VSGKSRDYETVYCVIFSSIQQTFAHSLVFCPHRRTNSLIPLRDGPKYIAQVPVYLSHSLRRAPRRW
jgi:hypothetical protein